MSVQVTTVSVGTMASILAAPASTDSDGISVQFTTPASPTIYVGPSDVTTGTGYALAASTEYFYDLRAGDSLSAVTTTGTVSLLVLRTGV